MDEVTKRRFPWYILIYFVKLPRKDITMRSSLDLFLVTWYGKRTTRKLGLGEDPPPPQQFSIMNEEEKKKRRKKEKKKRGGRTKKRKMSTPS